MIALVLLFRYSLLLLGFGRSPFCKREMRERESKGGESFFFGCDYDVALFLFSFSFCSVGVVFGVCLEQGERPEKRLAVAAVKKMVGGENFIRNLN